MNSGRAKALFRNAAAALAAAAAAIIAVYYFPKIWSPEHRLSDWMVTFVSPTQSVDPDIILVTVRDDRDFRERLSSLLPTDRLHLARLTQCLSSGGARVIGFDMLFDWPDAMGLPAFERSLAEAQLTTPVVIGTINDRSDHSKRKVNTQEIERLAHESKIHVGVVELLRSGSSGSVRSALGDAGAAPYRTFASLVTELSRLPVRYPQLARTHSFRIAWFHGSNRRDGLPIRFSDFSSLDVVDQCDAFGTAGVEPIVRGKIVLVGSQAQLDRHSVPFSTLDTYTDGMTGLEIHATIVAQLLRGPRIVVPGPIASFVIALIAATAGMMVHSIPRLRAWKKHTLIAIGLLATGLTWGLYALASLLLPISLILIAATNGAFAEQTAQGIAAQFKKIPDFIKRRSSAGSSQ